MLLLPMRRWAWLLAILPAFGCATKDLRAVITEYKPKVEPQLAKLEKIRDAARNAPRITVDHVDINGPAPKIGITDVDEHVNVAIEYLEDLDDFSALGQVPHRMLGSGSMNRCSAILKTHRYPYDPIVGGVPREMPWYIADDYFEHCAGVRYVFVIRSFAYAAPSNLQSLGPCPNPSSNGDSTTPVIADKPPADAGADAGGKATEFCRVFTGGYLAADVLVFDMKTVTQVGGFRFVAESSPRIDVNHANNDGVLTPDFSLQIRTAFQGAAQKYVPSFTTGY